MSPRFCLALLHHLYLINRTGKKISPAKKRGNRPDHVCNIQVLFQPYTYLVAEHYNMVVQVLSIPLFH